MRELARDECRHIQCSDGNRGKTESKERKIATSGQPNKGGKVSLGQGIP